MASVGFLVSVAITVCNLSKSVSVVGANFDMACMCYDNFLNFSISARFRRGKFWMVFNIKKL